LQKGSYSLAYQTQNQGQNSSNNSYQNYNQGQQSSTNNSSQNYNQGQNSSANNSNQSYSSSMRPGIPASQIPSGQEDLYILKSEIVPPVCPACPAAASCPRQEKPPPCPACARCPEPSFECKKVPNYNAVNDAYLPQPVLSDFSQFGM